MVARRRTTWRTQLRFDSPLDVDEVPEFHAARLLLLLRFCGGGKHYLIRGRTKLAKLDFFTRYPRFLEVALRKLAETGQRVPAYAAGTEGVEASMVRYRFGPWDHRFYNVLSFLRSRSLITVTTTANTENYTLTDAGRQIAEQFAVEEAFAPVVSRCRVIADVLGGKSGTELKDFIYTTFVDEVAALHQGTVISYPETSRGGQ